MKFVRFLLLLIAIPLGFTSLFVHFVHSYATNADVYKTAIEESGLYENLEDPTQYADLDDDDIQLFVGPLLEQFDVASLAQETAENNIDFVTDWIIGKDDLFLYFPVEEVKSRLQSDEFSDAVFMAFEENFSALPECTQEQLETFDSNGDEEGDFLPECKPPNFEEEFELRRAELQEELDEILSSDETFEEILIEADLEFISEKTPIETFIVESSDTPEDAQDTLDGLDTAERVFRLVRVLPFFGFIISLILIAIAAITRTKHSYKGMITVFLNSVIIIAVLLSIVSVASIIGRDFGLDQIPFEDISEDDSKLLPLQESLEEFARNASLQVVTSVSLLSFGILFVATILRAVIVFVPSMNSKGKALVKERSEKKEVSEV